MLKSSDALMVVSGYLSFGELVERMNGDATVIDAIEAGIERAVENGFKLAEMPLVHTFTPGLYSRQITMPEGTLVCSKIHLTEHQFILSKGTVSFWTKDGGEVIISAPYQGVTKPGTARALYIHEEAIWTTFHSTLLQTPEEIIDDITESYENPLLQGHYINNVFYPENKELVNEENKSICQ